MSKTPQQIDQEIEAHLRFLQTPEGEQAHSTLALAYAHRVVQKVRALLPDLAALNQVDLAGANLAWELLEQQKPQPVDPITGHLSR